ncbi:23S rRNA (adenine(2503)-C(2))-methyltransferase RlmN [Pelagibacterium montanilacus]|uniref:23S rRNA (adenine(2503)-C(2))-methyltransferase RlmN n=1 Tax=Pelagibacterium montanilacus TaxID=2185280 RepID=UPI000F8D3549|nr:23S rRNA (adenine(2503)-C(2))-methyltransferase RlmN [Pelagibacterium montanilacus]
MSASLPATPAVASARLPSAPHALDLTAQAFDALGSDGGAAITYRDLFSPHADLPRRLRAWAQDHGLSLRRLEAITRERGGRSEKLLFALPDGMAIETVLIRRRDGHTACVSSQVGCAFACRFCASGQAGLKRNLSAGEIVEQVVRLGPRVNRIVFMGIGEPLNNYDNVLAAIRILRERRGLAFPTTGITLSTIGIPKGLKALREEHLAINLTISLHATTQNQRAALIPGARKHDIGEVVARALSWAHRHNRLVTFVYLVLPGINDSPADLDRLEAMFAGTPARINLMRWNPVDGVRLGRTPDSTLSAFREGLARAGIPVAVRDTQGRDITAACGQLWLRDSAGRALAAPA